MKVGEYVDMEMVLENAKRQSKLPRWQVKYVREEVL